MRLASLVLFLSCIAASLRAQEVAPTGFAALELTRSRTCVAHMEGMADLNRRLEPLATRFDRLRRVAEGIALEDPAILDSLNTADRVERAVGEWFAADGELARRYVEEQDEALVAERAAARSAIIAVVQEEADGLQAQVRTMMDEAATVREGAAACQGAILVRSAVLEACQTHTGPVCEAAAVPGPTGPFRFVDAPEDLWDLEQIRPWSDPMALQVGPEGQLTGARTVASTRRGNVVLFAAVGPLLRDRNDMSPQETALFEDALDSLGITFEHPGLAFAPALNVRANLPEPLADETAYVLHFGPITESDVIWTGPAGTGRPIEASVMLTPAHVARLQSGATLALAAVKGLEEGAPELVLSIEITPVNQGAVIGTLMEYMKAQLSRDLTRLLPGSESPGPAREG